MHPQASKQQHVAWGRHDGVPHRLPLSLYLLEGWSSLFGTTVWLHDRTSSIGDSLRRFTSNLLWPRDKGSTPNLGQSLGSRLQPQLDHTFPLEIPRPLHSSLRVTLGRMGIGKSSPTVISPVCSKV